MQFAGPTLLAVATGVVGSAWASGMSSVASCHRSSDEHGICETHTSIKTNTGAITGLTLIPLQSAKAVPEKSTAFWADLYARGANIMPKVGAVVAVTYAYVAYDVRRAGGKWQLFAAAAASVVGIVPFTLLAMADTNDKLHKLAKDGGAGTDPEAKRLLDYWGVLNFVRGLLPLTGTILGIKAYLDNTQ
ncbi:integral membrane protein, Mpv17/PMP22 family [Purpureocillium lavendulum]|uniref:Integral membrane protein, Mpv17/PMP22 family n=1 Tax=Purpureocillium lavendulum TaxID=1247861 RepID=A0AB34FUP5_9HYPO|nr:integral membrane protein, Mpv17/PMP22 family [Purpureocillium lavendulum]